MTGFKITAWDAPIPLAPHAEAHPVYEPRVLAQASALGELSMQVVAAPCKMPVTEIGGRYAGIPCINDEPGNPPDPERVQVVDKYESGLTIDRPTEHALRSFWRSQGVTVNFWHGTENLVGLAVVRPSRHRYIAQGHEFIVTGQHLVMTSLWVAVNSMLLKYRPPNKSPATEPGRNNSQPEIRAWGKVPARGSFGTANFLRER
jgi:hypothetical protein